MRLARMPMAAAVLAVSTPLGALHAATVTWDGAAPGANWSAKDLKPGPNSGRTNWSGINQFPSVGDDLVFAGHIRLQSTNDLAALTSIGNLSFAAGAGAFTLSGRALGIGGVLDNASNVRQTLRLPVSATGAGVAWDGGSGGVNFSGGYGSQLIVDGAGSAWNNQGTLRLGDSVSLNVSGGAGFDNLGIVMDAASAWVRDAGTQLIARDTPVLGRGSRLSVSSGATLNSGSATVAGPHAQVYLSGDGTRWSAGSLLQVGESGEATSTVQIGGGSVLVTEVPEPATSTLWVGTLALAAAIRRHRRRAWTQDLRRAGRMNDSCPRCRLAIRQAARFRPTQTQVRR